MTPASSIGSPRGLTAGLAVASSERYHFRRVEVDWSVLAADEGDQDMSRLPEARKVLLPMYALNRGPNELR